ncbi:MAG: hypothetical protein A2074_04345 [Candidatus Aquicultor primus]|uniref:Lipoprotein n=1 Tax=Candidatus Aquicultor primus TaxID=1797195 RepID=A0A1F2UGC9_9ACTN|nr:MAG: hypothetical protein A2074_04345 [Candidatus Aquicultor primus]HCG99215.1 hypothetical protein [Actinomycetota bacterium]
MKRAIFFATVLMIAAVLVSACSQPTEKVTRERFDYQKSLIDGINEGGAKAENHKGLAWRIPDGKTLPSEPYHGVYALGGTLEKPEIKFEIQGEGYYIKAVEYAEGGRVVIKSLDTNLDKKTLKMINLYSDTDAKPESDMRGFAVYLVKDMKTFAASQVSLVELALEDKPFLTDDDLISYSWRDHKLKLNEDAIAKIPQAIPLDGRPVVVVADGQRIYLGALWTPVSSLSASMPTMTLYNGYLSIELGNSGQLSHGKSDPRDNARIYKALKDAGKLQQRS